MRALLLAVVLAVPARAQTRHMEASAESFAIDGSCAKTVAIIAGEPGRVTLDATADHADELAQLTLSDAPHTRLHPSGRACWRTPDGPTLAVVLHIPPAVALTIREAGSPTYRVAVATGKLTLEASGAVALTADRATSLALRASGSGRFTIARVDGPAKIELSGSGEVDIAAGDIPDLEVSDSGSGIVTVGATVAGGRASLAGSGTLTLSHLTGTLDRSIAGSGSVRVLGH